MWKKRRAHVSIILGFGLTFYTSDYLLKGTVAQCYYLLCINIFSFMYMRKATFGVECITYHTQTYGTYGRSLILFKYNGIPQERCGQRCGRAMLLCVCVIVSLVHISGVH